MLKKLAVISLAVGASVLSAPVAATAASDSYAKSPGVIVDDPIIDVCEVSTVAFGAGYFLPSEAVGVSVSGIEAGGASISGETAAADGSLQLTFRPPSDGEGTYTISFTGSRSYTATITVSAGHDAASSCDHDPAVGAAADLGTDAVSQGLATTGGEISPWALAGGAAAVIAGGALVAVGVSRRRHV